MSSSDGNAAFRRYGRRAESLIRRARRSHPLTFVALLALTVFVSSAALAMPSFIPTSILVIPLLLGGLLLRFKPLLALTVVTMLFGSYTMSERAAGLPKTGFILVLGLAAWIVLAGAKVRSRLGVQGTRGETDADGVAGHADGPG
jgi:hypothetical protein